MKITITELRKIIEDVVQECYGLPVESEVPLYGVKSTIGRPSQHDPKNSALRFPRGRNSRMTESFAKISPREMAEWRRGNWGFVQEGNGTSCGECGGAVIEGSCSDCGGGANICGECGGGMVEGECSECGGY